MNVAVVVGSKSDLPVIKNCTDLLDEFKVDYQLRVLSAHRTPDELTEFIRSAEQNEVQVYIAAAGMAAHLPGVVASKTLKPVIGVPLEGGFLHGLDSLMSVVQMPAGMPVACTAVGKAGAKNAALLAIQIMANKSSELAEKFKSYREAQRQKVLAG